MDYLRKYLILCLILISSHSRVYSQTDEVNPSFGLADIFDVEYATDPQISPDGKTIVYVRNFMDIMQDRSRSNLWIINTDGTKHRPLTSGNSNNFSPRWAPDGNRLLYISTKEGGGVELYIRWMDTGQTAKITNLTQSPGNVSWSHDGKWIAFTMFVPESLQSWALLPGKPKGAKWATPAKVIDKVQYRLDGSGYQQKGYTHLFLVPAEGGTPRQLTSGSYNHNGVPQWTANGEYLIISGNRNEDWEYNLQNTEIYKISVENGGVTALTDRNGPDGSSNISPDGKHIAYTGFDNEYKGYQPANLYVMNTDGSEKRLITGNFDRNILNPHWNAQGDGIYFQYDDKGNTKVGFVALEDGEIQNVAQNLAGSLGLPYSGGAFDVSRDGSLVFTYSRPNVPANIATADPSGMQQITNLNKDVFGYKKLGNVEEVWYPSSHDGLRIQGWIITPPDFDPAKKYPLILNIHGGPHLNYGDRFAAELQMLASAGYVVLYTNPRGSTSYGEEFANLIHHKFPGHDYDDLISGVDMMVDKDYIDKERLYVKGGSGGGLLTAWIVGKTNRFKAVVAEKPVINWYSFALTSDFYPYYHKYWFPGYPWENRDHYLDRSPISLVGNVETPTMVMSGEADHRVTIDQTEQYYAALKLRQVETVMVRIPDASHFVSRRPSQLMTKVAYTLEWFEKHP